MVNRFLSETEKNGRNKGDGGMGRDGWLLFQLLRSVQLLLNHFGVEDNASVVQGDFVCIAGSGYPYILHRGSYLECLYYAFQRSGSRVLSVTEAELAEQLYRLRGTEYDDEYRQMLLENRAVDRELRRRQKVRCKRQGRPRKK